MTAGARRCCLVAHRTGTVYYSPGPSVVIFSGCFHFIMHIYSIHATNEEHHQTQFQIPVGGSHT